MVAHIDELVVGVDACSGGWFATALAGRGIDTSLYSDFESLVADYVGAVRILVDIPIGLPTAERRTCDEQAKDLLGCRGISVFYPPCENAISCDDYATANQVQKKQMEHGLSKQAFNIRDEIQDVSRVVGNQYEGQIRESHPELCFYALNGQPIAYSKTSDRGSTMRTDLLRKTLEEFDRAYSEAREPHLVTNVSDDDILDSMVLAVGARASTLRTVPKTPDEDEPRIYYPEPATEYLEADST